MGLKDREVLYVLLHDSSSSSITYIEITSKVSHGLSIHDVAVLIAKQRSCWHET